MLVISNLNRKGSKFVHTALLLRELRRYLKSELTISVDTALVDDVITFKPIQGKRFLASNVENKIMIKNKERIAKLGRDFLVTTRVTKGQHKAFYDLLFNTITSLGLDATITLDNVPVTVGVVPLDKNNPI